MSTPQAIHPGIGNHSGPLADLDSLKVEDRLKEEMLRLGAINQDLLGNLGGDSKDPICLLVEPEELASLRAENAELRTRVEELEQALRRKASTEGPWSERQKELEEQRRQLEEDEASVMQQLREMEMAMSKDRAELARQRNEIQRLQNDLNHEIEIAARDPSLRGRLIALERLQGEITGRKQHAPPPVPNQPAESPTLPKPSISSSGLFRRIFGK